MTGGRARGLAPYLLVALAGLAPDAQAYLDPSTGSMILSAIVGMFATAALALKTYWYKLRNLFRRKDGESPTAPQRRPGDDSKPATD
jgi:multisubunit Na+/H+ antiporter MnhC subunit